ncbi:ABC transporter permease subunit [Acetanaerobacterium sp. MSJ-12]|uniref:ABC transporter permease subunit n=1 Tax=Oscillospiraceae TaxID=216572 RepID=UPI00163C9161|nr:MULTISPECIES: ABC transporter permease subunit [Oscillospiraceae]MBC2871554.1 ABC transporter permease subunit [Bittarella massiliensis (ex Durand et al. 2017)]MBU5418947.1 ABC transporter permease subunit [Acetanaerobacterium sp. MSJ-12]
MAKSRMFSKSVKFLLIAFFAITVFLPLAAMFSKVKLSAIGGILKNPQFGKTVLNSLSVTLAATVLSVLIAYLLALAVNRSRIPCKRLITVLATLPMLIPSISHGLGLTNLFGYNGLFTKLLGVESGLYGFTGILLGSILYSFPVAFLMLSDAMKYVDATPYEAAEVLGVPPVNRFFTVTMYYMKRPLVSAVFAVFTMVFTDYGVPLAVGGRFMTLPVYLYTEVIGLLNFSKGAFIGFILLLPAVITFLLDLRKKESEGLGFATKRLHVKKNRLRDTLLGVFCILVIGFVLLVIGSFAVMTVLTKYPYDLTFTWSHVQTVFSRGMGGYFRNSLIISLLVAAIGTVVGYVTAYTTARTKNALVSKVLHLTAIASLAIPGIVLGLGYVICFSNSFLKGTLLILVFVNIIHFFSSPYMMAHNAMKKLNPNFEDVGKTLGIGRVRLLWNVFVPCTLDTIAEMFGYFFVNSMITISAVAFLYSSQTMPLSLMINQMESSMMFEAAAFISLVILLSNVVAKGVISLVKSYCKRQYAK